MPQAKHCETCKCFPDPTAQAMARKRWEKDGRLNVVITRPRETVTQPTKRIVPEPAPVETSDYHCPRHRKREKDCDYCQLG